jgi:TolB-like protein/Flp pilus assembly protein TadD
MNFIDELKRRKVIRVGITYAVVAFVIMQLVEIIFPIFQIPLWASQFVIILLLIGPPVTLILAWVFDRTPEGIVKTPPTTESAEGAKSDFRPFYQKKRNLMLVAGVVAGLLIGRYGTGSMAVETDSDVDPKSVAVLPFDNYSTAPEDQFFSDGITEVIIANLAKVKDLKVISRTSVMEYKNTTKKMNEIAGELGVAHILEGSIQRVGDNIRIVGQLIDADSDKHIWAETYDGHISDVFNMQTDVAIKIANALESELTDDEKARINEKLTESTAAYEYYLKGNMYDNAGHTSDNIRAAITEYERAIALDPKFAEAHAQLGKMHAHMKWYGIDISDRRMVLSKESLDKAMKLKPNNTIVRTARGVYHYHGFREYGKAMADFTYARDLEPGNAMFNLYVGGIYRRLGDYEKAGESMRKAFDLDPRSVMILQNLKGTFNFMRDYKLSLSFGAESMNSQFKVAWPTAEAHYQMTGDAVKARIIIAEGNAPNLWAEMVYCLAIEDFQSALVLLEKAEEAAQSNEVYLTPKEYYLGLVARGTGKNVRANLHFEASLDYLRNHIDNNPNDPRAYVSLGLTYARLGNKREAIQAGIRATELLPIARDALFGTLHAKQLVSIYALVGDKEKALEMIEYLSTIPAGFHYGELKTDPVWNSIRGEPKFQAVLQKLKPVS